MKNNQSQMVDLLISHHQILVRSKPYDEDLSQWGKQNVEQGAVIHNDYVIFDPLPDGTFGANVHLTLTDNFIMDEQAQRSIVVPFYITDKNHIEVASAADKAKITLDLPHSLYSLYYEVCEGDEVFYKFTFVPSSVGLEPHYLLDDPWGAVKGARLVTGEI